MKILVSVVGRFHAFDLAYQLQKAGFLYKLNTTYPKHISERWGVVKSKLKSNLHLELLNRFGI